jgi:hypothetical protein
VAEVLRREGILSGYFDLYTSSDRPMNIYSKYFAKKLGFKDVAAAHKGVDYINSLYKQFTRIHDRAAQHHGLLMALTMHNRAAWSGKRKEARTYRRWLEDRLKEAEHEAASALLEQRTYEPKPRAKRPARKK